MEEVAAAVPSAAVAAPSVVAAQPVAGPGAEQLAGAVRTASSATRAAAAGPIQAAGEAALDPAVRDTRDKLLAIRVKLLRLSSRLGQTVRNTVVAQVLYRLDLAEKLKAGAGAGAAGIVGPERAAALAEQAEQAAGPESDLGFTCTILLLGKSGVGKSATVNSLLGASANAATNAFESETKEVLCVNLLSRPSLAHTLALALCPGAPD